MLRHISFGLYDQKSFYKAFIKDITSAKQRVVIESPFITSKRLNQLLPLLSKLVKRGVAVTVNTKPFVEHDELFRRMAYAGVADLQDIGVTVLMTVGHHRKLAIIDSDILWEGSLNILSQNDSCEIMRRIESAQITGETIAFLRLDRYLYQ
jgi:phosphatidylserine/phosphatidylglycerophosphate/cardiolipin synthase-like enzyme